MRITLPFDQGRQFNLSLLIHYMIRSRRTYLIVGAQRVVLTNHTKPESLDYWIRENVAERSDVMQATTKVVEQSCETGLFVETRKRCPVAGHICKAIELKTSTK